MKGGELEVCHGRRPHRGVKWAGAGCDITRWRKYLRREGRKATGKGLYPEQKPTFYPYKDLHYRQTHSDSLALIVVHTAHTLPHVNCTSPVIGTSAALPSLHTPSSRILHQRLMDTSGTPTTQSPPSPARGQNDASPPRKDL